MSDVIDFPSDIKVTEEIRASRTDVAFDGLFRFYRNMQNTLDVENCEFRPHYAKTFNFQGDLSGEIESAVSEYFEDPLEFIDLLLEVDSVFWPKDHEKNDEFYVSIIGVFLETTEQDGDYENGYYDILVLTPKIISYEIVDNNDAFLYLVDKEIFSEEKYGDD